MKYVVSLLVSLFLFGCVQSVNVESQGMAVPLGGRIHWHESVFPIPVYIDSQISASTQDAVMASIMVWNHYIGTEVFEYRGSRDMNPFQIPMYDVITITVADLSATPFAAVTLPIVNPLSGEMVAAVISLDNLQPEDPLIFIATIVHELGHAVGLEHDENPCSIMYESLACDSPFIEELDIQYIREQME